MIINGNALQIPLADKTVQCCITSPPYWGLRDYGVDGQLGLEPTPEQYVDNMVRVFREVRRVLWDDGVLWLNLGDSYAANRGCQVPDSKWCDVGNSRGMTADKFGLKPKDLVGIPWRVAFALQADGWYLRSDIIWHKPNCMPESVTDRPTKAHEYVFLLSKSARYFYDAEAIAEMASQPNGKPMAVKQHKQAKMGRTIGTLGTNQGAQTRNRRTVWTIPTYPYSGAHFATFPPKLVEPMILAGTSARGECPVCGLGWRRVVEKTRFDRSNDVLYGEGTIPGAHNPSGKVPGSNTRGMPDSKPYTIGWQPQCTHDAEPIPQLVLDPFGGTCTVGQVAIKYRRRFVGLELNGDYIELARERTSGVQVALL